ENDGGGAWLAWDTYRNIVLGHVGASGSSVETRTVDVSAAVVPPESPKGGSAEASSPQRLAKGPRDYHPVIASDGTSGLLVGWLHDTWSSGRYPVAARYDQSLRPLWTVNLSTRSGFATPPVICGDGSGGAFVAWVQVSQIG